MIWQAICSCGKKTSTHICYGTMKSDDYIKICLKKHILPLIRSHENRPVLFWPDLASIHYSGNSQDFMTKNYIDFVPKEWNPPNTPELRPIERYWAIGKVKLRRSKEHVNTPKEIHRKWANFSRSFGTTSVQRLMSGLTSKVIKFYKNN